jgi:monofunctional biosynthetic peptidoglycan transglycosylase
VLRLVRSLLCGAILAVACVPSLTVLQVLWVGLLDPPGTATTVQRVLAHWGEGHWGVVSHRAASLEDLGPHVPRAVVASEDARFFLHDGFDWESVCDAVGDASRGKRLRGASTITQQVAKNVFLWQGRSWLRKGAEVWYVLLLEKLLSKERILELYLGVAETGPRVFGLEAGAQYHYQKSASELSADQAARLAGILPDPLDRKPTGQAASERARWIHSNPAPFPGDKHYDLVLDKWNETWRGPWMCVF